MMERTLLPEDLERLGACRSIVAAKGASSPYVADCVVRAYQGRHLADLCYDLGWACDPATVIIIKAGIGTLRMTWTGNHLEDKRSAPATVHTAPLPAPVRLMASPNLRRERERICSDCTHRVQDRCSIAGCACAGLGQPAARFSRCPVGRW